jgi:hypothetical protein
LLHADGAAPTATATRIERTPIDVLTIHCRAVGARSVKNRYSFKLTSIACAELHRQFAMG